MKYYIIAGEASGDLHAGRLIRAIKSNDPQAQFRAWGGDLMEKEGAVLVKHYRDLAFMGFIEVIANLGTILRNMRFCKQDILSYAPDVVIFIDYPGFNIPLASFCKSKGFKTIYYISPQVWAWKEKRVKTIKRVVDKMLVILPFEKEFYKKWDYEVSYVGHPLIEIVDDFKRTANHLEFRKELNLATDKKIVGLLPGSRKQEIKKKLPIMLESTRSFPDVTFVIAQARSLPDELIQDYSAAYPNVKIIKGETYKLLSIADAAIVTSGTATLETALFGVPEVVCYKSSAISYAIGKRLVKVAYISLVNLIMNKKVVEELIQNDLVPDKISNALHRILHDENEIHRMKKDYAELHATLASGGKASEAAATIIRDFLA